MKYSAIFILLLSICLADSYDDFLDRAVSLRNEKKYEQAFEELKNAIKNQPARFEAYNISGWVMLDLKNPGKAAEFFQTACRYSENMHGNSFQGLGCAYQGINRWNDAAESFEKALLLDRDDMISVVKLIETYWMLKNTEKCLYYCNILEPVAVTENLMQIVAVYYEKCGQMEKSMEFYTKLCDQYSTQEYVKGLFRVSVYLSRFDTARTLYSKLKNFDGIESARKIYLEGTGRKKEAEEFVLESYNKGNKSLASDAAEIYLHHDRTEEAENVVMKTDISQFTDSQILNLMVIFRDFPDVYSYLSQEAKKRDIQDSRILIEKLYLALHEGNDVDVQIKSLESTRYYAEGLQMSAKYYFDRGNFNKAVQYYEKLITQKKDFIYCLRLSESYLKTGNPESAIQMLKECKKLAQTDAQLYQYTVCAAQCGLTAEAVRILEEISETDGNQKYLKDLFRLSVENDDFERAQRVFKKIDDFETIEHSYRRFLQMQGKNAEAEDFIISCYYRNPTAENFSEAAQIMIKRKSEQEAIQFLQQFNSEKDEQIYSLLISAARKREYPRLLKILIEEADRSGLNLASEKFYAAIASRDSETAEQLLNTLSIPEDGYRNLGTVFFEKKNYEKAVFYLKKVVDKNPEDAISILRLADSLSFSGFKSGAQELLMKNEKMYEGDNMQAMFAYSCKNAGLYEKALQIFKKCQKGSNEVFKLSILMNDMPAARALMQSVQISSDIGWEIADLYRSNPEHGYKILYEKIDHDPLLAYPLLYLGALAGIPVEDRFLQMNLSDTENIVTLMERIIESVPEKEQSIRGILGNYQKADIDEVHIRSMIKTGKISDALQQISELHSAEKKSELYEQAALRLKESGLIERAEECFETSFLMNKNNISACAGILDIIIRKKPNAEVTRRYFAELVRLSGENAYWNSVVSVYAGLISQKYAEQAAAEKSYLTEPQNIAYAIHYLNICIENGLYSVGRKIAGALKQVLPVSVKVQFEQFEKKKKAELSWQQILAENGETHRYKLLNACIEAGESDLFFKNFKDVSEHDLERLLDTAFTKRMYDICEYIWIHSDTNLLSYTYIYTLLTRNNEKQLLYIANEKKSRFSEAAVCFIKGDYSGALNILKEIKDLNTYVKKLQIRCLASLKEELPDTKFSSDFLYEASYYYAQNNMPEYSALLLKKAIDLDYSAKEDYRVSQSNTRIPDWAHSFLNWIFILVFISAIAVNFRKKGLRIFHIKTVTIPGADICMLVVITIIGAYIRWYLAQNSILWIDETATLSHATQKDIISFFRVFLHDETHPPLYYFSVFFMVKLFGSSQIILKLPSLLFGVMCIPLIYWLGRLLMNRQAALFSAGIIAFSPFFCWQSSEARHYSLVAMLSIMNYIVFLHFIKYPEKKFWKYSWVTVSILMLYTFYFSVFVFLAENVYALLFFRKKELIKQWIIMQFTVIMFLVPWLILAGSSPVKPGFSDFMSVHFYQKIQHRGLNDFLWTFYNFIFYEEKENIYYAIFLTALLAAVGYSRFRGSRAAFIACIAFLPVFGILIITMIAQKFFGFSMFDVRYVITGMPGAVMALVFVIFSLPRFLKYLVILIFAAGIGLNLFNYETHYHRRALRDIMNFVQEHDKKPQIITYILDSVFQYHYPNLSDIFFLFQKKFENISDLKELCREFQPDTLWFVSLNVPGSFIEEKNSLIENYLKTGYFKRYEALFSRGRPGLLQYYTKEKTEDILQGEFVCNNNWHLFSSFFRFCPEIFLYGNKKYNIQLNNEKHSEAVTIFDDDLYHYNVLLALSDKQNFVASILLSEFWTIFSDFRNFTLPGMPGIFYSRGFPGLYTIPLDFWSDPLIVWLWQNLAVLAVCIALFYRITGVQKIRKGVIPAYFSSVFSSNRITAELTNTKKNVTAGDNRKKKR